MPLSPCYLQTESIYRNAMNRPAAIRRLATVLDPAPLMKAGVLVLAGGAPPVDWATPPGALVGVGVTVITEVMTVGMQVEMVMVLKTGAGEETGATEVYGGAGTELEATTPAGELVGTGGATALELTAAACELVGYKGGEVSVAVTGQTVVYKSITTVVVWGPAGQLVTVGAHEVTVITLVSRTVEVV